MVPSPALSAQSADDLFDIPARPLGYETIETEPVQRITDSPIHDTLASLPPIPQSQSQYLHSQRGGVLGKAWPNSQYVTQPTQIIQRSPDKASVTDLSSPPPSRSTVQVMASSPIAATKPRGGKTSGGILGTAMNNVPAHAGHMGVLKGLVPAGSQLRLPQQAVPRAFAPAQSSTQSPPQRQTRPDWFPEDGPESSDSDRLEAQRNSIKTKTFKHKNPPSTNGPQSTTTVPPTSNTFSGLLSEFGYQPAHQPSHGVKRSGDVMANSYGGITKKPRQIAPARAQPIELSSSSPPQPQRKMELNDIEDPGLRGKVQRLLNVCTSNSIEQALSALNQTKNFDDAADLLLLHSEKLDKQQNMINQPPQQQQNGRQYNQLPESDDELLMTPAKPPKGIAMNTQQFYIPPPQQVRKVPGKSIVQKYSTTQQLAPAPVKRLDVFDTPLPQEPRKRTLMRGRKDRSLSPNSQRKAITLDDSADEADSGVQSEDEDAKFDSRVLEFFNTCTALELSDISGIPKDQAEHFTSSRPFKSLQKVFDVQNPTNKNKSKKSSFGERTWDKVYEMMKSYEAVDFVVRKCENLSKPLTKSMSSWGVDVYGKGKNDTGLDLVSIDSLKGSSQDSAGKDSGIGTPISDDGKPMTAAKRGFIPQPPSLAEGVKMKDYQIVGLNWLYLLFKNNVSGILADDMGLGKTLQTIAFIAHLAELGEPGPHLICVPSATLENWLKEFQRFAPGLSVRPYYGSIPEREEMRVDYENNRKDINVIVTTYQIAKAKDDIPWLRRYPFTCAIFDEGHMLKNPTSEVATKLTKIKPRFRLLLTGTPLQNNLNELMGLLKFLMPQVFAEREEDLSAIFKQSVSVTTSEATSDSRSMLLSKQRIERARSMLTPFILRRKKWQVLKDLPKKTRHVVACSMTPEQQELYNTQLAKAWDVRERKSRGERVPAEENANVLIRLRQAAIHPLLFRYFYSDKTLRRIAKTCPKIEQFRLSNPELIMTELVAYADFETHDLCSKHTLLHPYLLPAERWEKSGKITKLLELLAKFKSEGHRVLVFSQFVMVLDILQIVLNNHQIPFLRLDGSTRVDERQDLIDLFNLPDSEFEVFMLSTKAGGAGINLTGANRVIVFDSGFNPQDDVQAENRCHRIGQLKDVEVYRLISEGSVEEQIYEMGKVKLQLDREVAGEEGQAVDLPASGIATPAELDEDLLVAKKAGRLSKKVEDPNGGLSKKEAEGAALIEDMLFQKLEEQGKTASKLNGEAAGSGKTLPNPRIKINTSVEAVKSDQSSLSSLDSPLTELSSMDSDDDKLLPVRAKNRSSSPEVIDIMTAGRSRRKAAQKASENLKDPFADEPSSQKSTRSTRGAKVKEEKNTKGKGQATISRSGRVVRARKD